MTILTYAFVQVIVSSIRTNRVRCALYKKILDLLDKESFSGESSGRASSNSTGNRKCESIANDSKVFLVHKHTYIYMWTPTPITLPR